MKPCFNSLRPKQNRRNFTYDIFKYKFWLEKGILIDISSKLFPDILIGLISVTTPRHHRNVDQVPWRHMESLGRSEFGRLFSLILQSSSTPLYRSNADISWKNLLLKTHHEKTYLNTLRPEQSGRHFANDIWNVFFKFTYICFYN